MTEIKPMNNEHILTQAINKAHSEGKKPCIRCITMNYGGNKLPTWCEEHLPEFEKEQQKKFRDGIEKQIEELKPKTEWKRTTFDFHEGKAWCYRKMEQFKTETWSSEELRPTGYYCGLPSCRNELIFKWNEKDYRDNTPFKFHKALIKILEKKDDDWKTGRKTHTYYAFCCKCAKLRHGDSDKVVKQKFIKKLMKIEVDKCECDTFIEDKKKEANQAIIYHNSVIADCNELIKELEPLKAKHSKGIIEADNGYKKTEIDKNFKARRVNDFIKQLESRRSDEINSRIKEEDYLKLYNEWETKRNQQLNDYDTRK